MKLLISGATGLLGGALIGKAEVLGLSPIAMSRADIDLQHVAQTADQLNLYDVDVLIHCAANTNVEACENDPQRCFADNVVLTEVLAGACALTNTKMVLISSTGVYGDSFDGLYNEFHHILPTTVHHRSKVLAESAVLSFGYRPLIIRTGWLFGGEISNRKNFVVGRIKEALCSGGTMYSDPTQVGNPCYVQDVAAQILRLVMNSHSGIFNCVNKGAVSRFEYVKEVISIAGIDVSVLPAPAGQFKRAAKVSHNETAENAKLVMLGLDEMPDWRVGMKEYIGSIIGDLIDD